MIRFSRVNLPFIKLRWSYWAAYALLLVLWTLLVAGARALSFSMDEPAHIVAGYVYLMRWKEASWHFLSYLHPPLINMAEAIGLFLAQPHIPLETLAGWGREYATYTQSFLPYLMPMERTEILSRTPVMLLTILLGAVVFRWGIEIGGRRVGLLALTLLTFDPTLLASGRLATTDMGVTALGMAALYVGWRWLERPSWRYTFLIGGLLGLTMLAKMSGILWSAAFGLIALGSIIVKPRHTRSLRFFQAMVAGLLAGLVVWAVFDFSVGLSPLLPFLVPAPAYLTAFHNLQTEAAPRIFIAFEQTWTGTHWWYFPLNFLIKNPLPLLVALLVGGWSFASQVAGRPRLLALGVFPGVYLLFSVLGGMNVSYRHMLPLHPFLHLLIAQGLASWLRQRRNYPWPRLVWGALGLWYIFGTLHVFPDELAYFNELVGGPDNGYRYLTDYTQDWGQSFKELRNYLRASPGPEPNVVYFTPAHPGFYGVEFRPLFPTEGATQKAAPFHPQPGRYVMGVAPLYGLVGPDPLQLEWFRRARPTAIVGHGLFVYDVVSQPLWLSQCVTPVIPLDDAAIRQGFGLDRPGGAGLRQANFDCTAAWLYPGGGKQSSIYALHHDLLEEQSRCFPPLLRCDPLPEDPFITRRLADARLSYEQRNFSLLPAFALYERGSAPVNIPPLRWMQAARAETPPAALANSHPVTVPVSMNGPLVFLGAMSYNESDGLEVETWWQVAEGAIARPFSIMAHLLTEQGEVISVADGLGVSPAFLETSDVVVQRHRFSNLPPGQKGVWLRTGVYWLDTMERWPIANVSESDALFVRLDSQTTW